MKFRMDFREVQDGFLSSLGRIFVKFLTVFVKFRTDFCEV